MAGKDKTRKRELTGERQVNGKKKQSSKEKSEVKKREGKTRNKRRVGTIERKTEKKKYNIAQYHNTETYDETQKGMKRGFKITNN